MFPKKTALAQRQRTFQNLNEKAAVPICATSTTTEPPDRTGPHSKTGQPSPRRRDPAERVPGTHASYDAAPTYPGGKGKTGIFHRLIRLIPPHDLYIDLFAGHSAILRHKRPAAASVAVDASAGVIDWWRRRNVPNLTLLHDHAPRILASLPALMAAASVADPARVFIYIDAPYLATVRTRRLYECEFDTPQEHASLLAMLQDCPARVLISHYPCSLYDNALAKWNRQTYTTTTRGSNRTEAAYFNYPEPQELHDPRYAGSNYRERLRIKRKIERWRRRLAAMHPLERQALTEALAVLNATADVATTTTTPP
jgi:DNA adenine methylase